MIRVWMRKKDAELFLYQLGSSPKYVWVYRNHNNKQFIDAVWSADPKDFEDLGEL